MSRILPTCKRLYEAWMAGFIRLGRYSSQAKSCKRSSRRTWRKQSGFCSRIIKQTSCQPAQKHGSTEDALSGPHFGKAHSHQFDGSCGKARWTHNAPGPPACTPSRACLCTTRGLFTCFVCNMLRKKLKTSAPSLAGAGLADLLVRRGRPREPTWVPSQRPQEVLPAGYLCGKHR